MKFLPKLKKLNSRGISHIILPMLVVVAVGVVGTYLLVGSHAATPKPEGLLIVYGGVDYTGFDIKAVNLNTKTHTCGGKWSPGGTLAIPKKLHEPILSSDNTTATVDSVTLHCTPTNGLESYHVNYMNGKVTNYTEIAVDIDANFCTYVHTDGRQEKSALNKGKCADAITEKTKAHDISIQVKPTVGKNKITGWVGVYSGDEKHHPITKKKCTGQVTVTLTEAPATVADTVNLPLKFAAPDTGKSKGYHDPLARCVAQLNFTGLKKATLYNIRADFAGSAFFIGPVANGANATTLK